MGRIKRGLLAFAVCGVTLLLCVGVASAASYTVTTTADSADGSCTPQVCSLRDALAAVNARPGASDLITLPAGTYTLGGTQLPVITNSSVDLTLVGAGARTTTISANRQSRVLEIDAGKVAIYGVTLTQGSLTDNGGTGGGAIYNHGTLILTDAAVTNSVAMGTTYGGGIASRGTLVIDRVTVSGNRTSSDGGGIAVLSGTASITNSTISGNTVDTTLPGTPDNYYEYGGGLDLSTGPDTLSNVTIANNTLNPAGRVGGGGGVYGASALAAANSIIADNQPGDCSNGLASTGAPNLDTDSTCFSGGGSLHADPRLQPLANNGGQLDTQALTAGSPAIGAGPQPDCPATDERGLLRPSGPCDLGAYQTAPPSATTASASGISPNGATLAGEANPNDQQTTAYFQYGTTAAYGSQTAPVTVGGDYATHSVSTAVGSLTPASTYHYRLVAVSALGTTYGSDQTFTTRAAPVPLPAPSPAPRPAHFTLGRVAVHGVTFSIPIACRAGAACRGSVAFVLNERLKDKKVVSAVIRRVVVKRVAFSIAAGAHKTLKVTLGPAARTLLTRLGRLAVTIKLTLTSGPKTTQTAVRTVTVRTPPPKKRRR